MLHFTVRGPSGIYSRARKTRSIPWRLFEQQCPNSGNTFPPEPNREPSKSNLIDLEVVTDE